MFLGMIFFPVFSDGTIRWDRLNKSTLGRHLCFFLFTDKSRRIHKSCWANSESRQLAAHSTVSSPAVGTWIRLEDLIDTHRTQADVSMLFRSIHRNLWRQGSAGFFINVVISRLSDGSALLHFSFTGILVVITLVSCSPLFRLIQHFLRNDSIVFGQEHIKSVMHALSFALIKQTDDMEFGRHSPVRHTVCACSTASASSSRPRCRLQDRLNVTEDHIIYLNSLSCLNEDWPLER
ncbi:hypothetical protein BDW60DRAFT_105347 [Aspergillus nidulans var. acristatus]